MDADVSYVQFQGQFGTTLTIDLSDTSIDHDTYNDMILIPIMGEASLHPNEVEVLMGNIPIKLLQRDPNHPAS